MFFSKQFVLFIFTGGIAAAVNFGSRIVINNHFSFSTSIILAYILGMITAFILATLLVFKASSQSTLKSIFYFSLVNAAAILQTWAVSLGLAFYLLPYLGVENYVKEIAHLAGVIVPVFTSFLGHKHFSFKEEAVVVEKID
jgi:putative flippase GtrA